MRSTKKLHVTLWVIQILLAGLFLFAGGMKLVAPPEALAGPVSLPVPFLRFIGLMETLGALGLVLPGLFRIRTGLTPLAAAGLVIIMTGAVVVSAAAGPAVFAAIPGVVGVLAGCVAWGRRPRGGIALRATGAGLFRDPNRIPAGKDHRPYREQFGVSETTLPF